MYTGASIFLNISSFLEARTIVSLPPKGKVLFSLSSAITKCVPIFLLVFFVPNNTNART